MLQNGDSLHRNGLDKRPRENDDLDGLRQPKREKADEDEEEEMELDDDEESPANDNNATATGVLFRTVRNPS